MPKYQVRYYKEETSTVRYDIEVEADDPEAARERVRANMEGEIEDLTDEERETEMSGKEELDSSTFSQLEDADDPYAVTEKARCGSSLATSSSRLSSAS